MRSGVTVDDVNVWRWWVFLAQFRDAEVSGLPRSIIYQEHVCDTGCMSKSQAIEVGEMGSEGPQAIYGEIK